MITSDPQYNVVLPAQLGPYPVSIYEHEVKTMRPDPLAPTPQLRRLMITVYRPFLDNFTCPLEHQSKTPYVPPVVAEAVVEGLSLNLSSSVFDPVQLVNCSQPVPSSSPSGPLLLFSHGYGGTHHFYASIVQAAASSGYTVVSIDHTYEAAAVVFPDGYVAYTSKVTNAFDETLEGINFLLSVRVNDTVSVLNAIERGEVPGLSPYPNSHIYTSNSSSTGCNSNSTSTTSPLRTVMYGHSFGGSTAVQAAASDPRVLAAANIDGLFYGPIANGTVRKPLLMMSSAPQDVATDWPAFYPTHVRGWKTWVRPNDTEHYSFTDLPLLVDLLSLPGTVVPQDLTGMVDGRRLQEIVWRYTLQFFDYVLMGVTPDLLDEPTAEFPDVEFVGHAEAGTGQ
jgi:pimeloyl-ACP methyl ester carboxylesterase